MLQNYWFSVPIEKFTRLTGRSIASFKRDFQKAFDKSPRKWPQEKRLTEAYYQIAKNLKKPTEAYLEFGFESLLHFSSAFKRWVITPSRYSAQS